VHELKTTHTTGQCFCGAVEFELTAEPMFTHACHCRDCQIQTGGPFAINAIIEAEHVKQTKGPALARFTMPAESGRPHDIYRCPQCATALWSDYGRREVMLFVRVATLKDAGRFTPDVHIFTRSKLPCDQIPLIEEAASPAENEPLGETLPNGVTTKKPAKVFAVYYSTKGEWPADSLARRNAVLAKMKS
jgi:hypothetical protein